ncbi:MAG: pyridoxamine 5'-phosphate oxidase family protein [Bacillus sp. (in: Bacteria)]|nr:pyridoxamine 5'-phosphate oxidase family protein [Bacillus sp. (in: firmicutes)]
MGKFKRELTEELIAFINEQKLFFVATAPSDEGRVNLSPKGYDSFKVVDHNTIAYLDYVGSGNETANHLNDNGKITFMWCSFDEKPLILRAYCYGQVMEKGTEHYMKFMQLHFPHVAPEAARQIFVCQIEAVQTSCGFGVPLYDFIGERETMKQWTEKKLAKGELDDYMVKHGNRLDEKLPVVKREKV